MISRRSFLRRGSLAVAAGSLAPSLLSGIAAHRGQAEWIQIPFDGSDEPVLRELAARALDAARAGGASYADVRFTRTQSHDFGNDVFIQERYHLAVGVRALVHGMWGFVAIPVWDAEQVARAGGEAAAQAAKNRWGGTGAVELGPPPPVASGSWRTPMRRDPFEISIEEKMDYLYSLIAAARALNNPITDRATTPTLVLSYQRQARTFASTDGAFITQTVYHMMSENSSFNINGRVVDDVCVTSGGWDAFTDLQLEDRIEELYDEAQRYHAPVPADVGRYDVVLDAPAMSAILHYTVGEATEADRARGYEANAGGTSYLPAPDALGTSLAPLLSVSATRSQPGGAAWVKWDDEGVAPRDFPLVANGRLMNFSTSREHIAPLGRWYEANGIPLVSNGCSASGDAMDVPLVFSPDLKMQPGTQSGGIDALVADVKRGYLVRGGTVAVDHQRLNGQGMPNQMYEIRNGKIGKAVSGSGYLFRSPEFWKGVAALGGPETLRWYGRYMRKGQPQESSSHSVAAVPALVRDMRVINLSTGLSV